MTKTTVTLVLSSMKEIDSEAISGLVPLRPFTIWRRRKDIVVHGIDDIAAMSWNYEKQRDGALESQQLVDQMLNEVCWCRAQIREAVETFGLRATLIICLKAEDEAACADVSSDYLEALGAMKCRLRFDLDNGY